MKRPAWLTPDVRAWALYDAASSIWIAAIPTILYALYFRSVVMSDDVRADAAWALTAAAALAIAGIVAPWIGARADLSGSRLRWLAAATAACCLATAAMAWVGPGQVLFGAAVFVAAQVGYTVGMSLYDAYLARISTVDNVGRVSSFGWAAGFLGGVASLIACIALLRGAESSAASRFGDAFLLIALLFAAASVPAIVGLRSLPGSSRAPAGAAPGGAAKRVAATMRSWRAHHNAVKFLAALYLINDALVTIAFFAAIYFGDQFGLTLVELLQLGLLYQVLAIPGTLAFGRFADRVSPHTAIYASLAIWIVAVLLMAFGTGGQVPYIVVALFAMVFGSTQALMRGMYALLVPEGQAGEFFGFNALAGRLSAAAGPLLYGAVSAATGSQQAALLSVLVFLIGGAIVLSAVRLDEAPDARGEAPRPAP